MDGSPSHSYAPCSSYGLDEALLNERNPKQSDLSDESHDSSDIEYISHEAIPTHRHGSSSLSVTKSSAPYHPVVDKMGKIFDCKINSFENSLKKLLQDQLTSVLARIDQLETELKDTKRALDFQQVSSFASLPI